MTDPSEQRWINALREVGAVAAGPDRGFFSTTHGEISRGLTTDIYFVTTQEILRKLGRERTVVAVDVFARCTGVFLPIAEVLPLLARS